MSTHQATRSSRTRRLATGAVVAGTLTAAGVAAVVAALPASSATTAASSVSPFDVPAGTGASVPFVEYEAEGSHATTNGSVTGPDYTQGTVASEASGRRAVQLSGQGKYVEFTLTAAANAVNVAYNLNQGASGTLSVYLNGTKLAKSLPVTSKYSYLSTPGIPGSKTHHLFDDSRMMLPTAAKAGDKVRFQVDSGDVATTVDLADFENVAGAATQPAGSISVTDAPYSADASGNGDATNAFNQAINAARSQNKVLWIPQGTFNINSALTVSGVTVQGAGPWYSVLHGTHIVENSSSSAPTKLANFAVFGEVNTRNDGSPDNFVNGRLGNGSVIDNIWVQHQKVGIWLVGADNNNLTVQNCRFLDLTADGINFNGSVTNSVVKNNFFRNTGDDSLAMWSIYSADANDTFANNTIVQPNLANGIAIYGGSNITLSKNVIADTNALGSGIALSNQQFMSGMGFAPLAGTMSVTGNTLIRTGAMNPNWNHPMGAIRVDAYDYAVQNVAVNITDTTAIDSPYSVFEVVGGGGTGLAVTGLTVDRATLTNVGTVVLQAETQGSGTFSNVVATGVGAAGVYNCPYPTSISKFNPTMGTGNSGWSSTWSSCSTWPSPGTPTGEPTTSSPTGNPTPTDVPAGTNVALNKPATDSGHSESYVAGNAVDGNTSTYWESTNNAFPQTITVDLGAKYTVNKVTMNLPPASAWATRTQTLSVLGSTDGSTFTTLVGSAGYVFDPATGNTASATFTPAAVRYVQLKVTANTGWPAAQLAELQVITGGTAPTTSPSTQPTTSPTGVPSGTNLAKGRPVTDSGHADVYQAGNAVDGNLDTYWESTNNAFPQTITVDLGAAYGIGKVVLNLPPASAWATRTQTLSVLGSTDGSTFTTLVGSAGYVFNPATGNTVTITTSATTRYVQLRFTANTGWPAAQLSEFQVVKA